MLYLENVNGVLCVCVCACVSVCVCENNRNSLKTAPKFGTTIKWLAPEFIPFDRQRRRQEAFHQLKKNTPERRKMSYLLQSFDVPVAAPSGEGTPIRPGILVVSTRDANHVRILAVKISSRVALEVG